MTLFGNRVFVAVIKIDPNPMASVLLRRRKFGQREKGDTHPGEKAMGRREPRLEC